MLNLNLSYIWSSSLPESSKSQLKQFQFLWELLADYGVQSRCFQGSFVLEFLVVFVHEGLGTEKREFLLVSTEQRSESFSYNSGCPLQLFSAASSWWCRWATAEISSGQGSDELSYKLASGNS